MVMTTHRFPEVVMIPMTAKATNVKRESAGGGGVLPTFANDWHPMA